MPFISAESLIFFLSSLLTFALAYLKISVAHLLKIIAILLVVLLFLLRRYFFSRSRPIPTDKLRHSLIFLSSLTIQLLVFSTGGFFSPFLPLLHLYTLASSFLLNLSTSLSFLIFSMLVLFVSILVDQNALLQFYDDPWSVILYAISFLAMIPLSQILVRYYNLKDTVTKILTRQIQLKEKQIAQEERLKESLLESFADLVLVTDANLRILSANEAAKSILRLTKKEIIAQPLLDILILRGSDGSSLDAQKLKLDEIQANQKPLPLKSLLLYTENNKPPSRVSLYIRPVTDLEGKVDQITFVISDEEKVDTSEQSHFDLERAWGRHDAMIEQFKEKLKSLKLEKLVNQAEALSRAEEDLLTTLEVEHHSIEPKKTLRNIDRFCEQIASSQQEFAQGFGVALKFVWPTPEVLSDNTAKVNRPTPFPIRVPSPYFITTIDVKWFEKLVEKVIEIAIILASEKKNSEVGFDLNHQEGLINIRISTPYRKLSPDEQKDLFMQYYGSLGSETNLALGSGLEGYLVKMIATRLNIPLGLMYDEALQKLSFVLRLQREIPQFPFKIAKNWRSG